MAYFNILHGTIHCSTFLCHQFIVLPLGAKYVSHTRGHPLLSTRSVHQISCTPQGTFDCKKKTLNILRTKCLTQSFIQLHTPQNFQFLFHIICSKINKPPSTKILALSLALSIIVSHYCTT